MFLYVANVLNKSISSYFVHVRKVEIKQNFSNVPGQLDLRRVESGLVDRERSETIEVDLTQSVALTGFNTLKMHI